MESMHTDGGRQSAQEPCKKTKDEFRGGGCLALGEYDYDWTTLEVIAEDEKWTSDG